MRVELQSAAQIDTSTSKRSHAKLMEAAQQFEGMLLQEMLKPMRSSEDSWLGEQKDLDAAAGTMSSFGTEAVATAIAKRGGLGIALKVVQQVGTEALQHSQKSTSQH